MSKVEARDRRLDVVEYVYWMRSLDMDLSSIIAALAADLDQTRYRRVMAKR